MSFQINRYDITADLVDLKSQDGYNYIYQANLNDKLY